LGEIKVKEKKLLRRIDGNLYGISRFGGPGGFGIIFQINLTGGSKF